MAHDAIKSVTEQQHDYESVQLRIHPQVFAALGKDLVTNDIVAVIELVKNSYDAFANNVWLKFGNDEIQGNYLEIQDDGIGMTKEIIENQWCVVGTPFKKANTTVQKGNKVRRVTGNKGLGRLSVARLGNRLVMLTKTAESTCWEVTANWPEISGADELSQSTVGFREHPGATPFAESGTHLYIYDLAEQWDQPRITELEDNLSRLISPFANSDEFNIFLETTGNNERVSIESSQLLSEPKYTIKGNVDDRGNITAEYKFAPIKTDGAPKTSKIDLNWNEVYDSAKNRWRFSHSYETANCGPFSFEIRAWDTDAEGTREISEKYNLTRRAVSKAIRAHKGISVYRDEVLVLPKSERGLDWLGLDLRRVSQIGRRLSTSQIVGYVSISAISNPNIEDTSDRERLSVCPEVEEFEAIIMYIVRALEIRKNEDHISVNRETPMADIFAELSANNLINEATALASSGASATAVVPLISQFDESLNRNRETIKSRFAYYSQLATIGTIAQMLVHEIRNQTTAIGKFLSLAQQHFQHERKPLSQLNRAERAIQTLEGLADRFSPLANRNFRRGIRQSILETRIRECVEMHQGQLKGKNIECSVPNTHTEVMVDPGELDTIIINLITNATYWLDKIPKSKRRLEFVLEQSNSGERVTIWIHDTGPGIKDDDVEKIFWPGLTRKPKGIGMGLTIASELAAAYGGQMRNMHPGKNGGASFAFDLPIAETNQEAGE